MLPWLRGEQRTPGRGRTDIRRLSDGRETVRRRLASKNPPRLAITAADVHESRLAKWVRASWTKDFGWFSSQDSTQRTESRLLGRSVGRRVYANIILTSSLFRPVQFLLYATVSIWPGGAPFRALSRLPILYAQLSSSPATQCCDSSLFATASALLVALFFSRRAIGLLLVISSDVDTDAYLSSTRRPCFLAFG